MASGNFAELLMNSYCMVCLKLDYKRWGTVELYPREYRGVPFDLDKIPEELLPTIFSKMSQNTFTKMRRTTKFYGNFIEENRQQIKPCLFHNRALKVTFDDPKDGGHIHLLFDRLPNPGNCGWTPIFSMDWTQIEELVEEDMNAIKMKDVEMEKSLPTEFSKDSEMDALEMKVDSENCNNCNRRINGNYVDIDIDLIDRNELIRELTGHFMPLCVTILLQKEDTQADRLAEFLKAVKIKTRILRFDIVKENMIKHMSELMNPEKMKITQSSIIPMFSMPESLLSFHHYRHLKHLVLVECVELNAALPDSILSELEYLSLFNCTQEWNTLAVGALQLFKSGNSQLQGLYIAPIYRKARETAQKIMNRRAFERELRKYYTNKPALKEFTKSYKTNLYLLQNQITEAIGIVHISEDILSFQIV